MSENKKISSFIARSIQVLIPVMLIVAGGAAWSYFTSTVPVMKKSPPKREVFVVDVQRVHRKDARTVVSAMGTVVPAREVTVKAQVSGVVRDVSDRYVPGGRMKKGENLLMLDPTDYEVAVMKAKSALADAKASLAIEQGSQNIAREELKLFSELSAETVVEKDLALRKPQLLQAQAAVESAEADLRQAMLNLNRTMVKAPFNAMIVSRSVDVGAYVGSQESLATLVGTDAFWIEAVVPLDQLSLIDLDAPGGCTAVIRSQSGGGTWDARVVQIAGKLNESSRMATVILSVANPLERGRTPLMIDDYVYADITGRALTDVIELPRAALQDDDTVWINHESALDIRKVTVAWKNADKVFLLNGVQSGELVVVSNLSTPVPGMALKTADVADDRPAMETDDKRADS